MWQQEPSSGSNRIYFENPSGIVVQFQDGCRCVFLTILRDVFLIINLVLN